MKIPKSYKLAVFLLFSLGLAFPRPVLSAVTDYKYQASASIEINRGNYALLELPDEVLAQASPSYQDIRIYAGEEEIPFAIAPDYLPNSSGAGYRPELLNLGLNVQRESVFTLRQQENAVSNSMNILTPNKNFVRKLKLEGSSDEKNWILLQHDATIFDLSREKNFRSTSFTYAKTNYPFLRVTVLNEGQEPLQIEGVELNHKADLELIGQVRSREHSFEYKESQDGQTEFVIDLYQENLPSHQIKIMTSDQNFNRKSTLDGSNDLKNWVSLYTGEMFSYNLQKLQAQKLSLDFKGNYRYYRLRIQNGDNKPLAIKDIDILGTNPLLVFSFDAGKKYQVLWGHEFSKFPVYDIEKYKINLDYTEMSKLALGKPALNEKYIPKDERPWSERNPWLLQGALLLTIAVLAWLAIRSFRKINQAKVKK